MIMLKKKRLSYDDSNIIILYKIRIFLCFHLFCNNIKRVNQGVKQLKNKVKHFSSPNPMLKIQTLF